MQNTSQTSQSPSTIFRRGSKTYFFASLFFPPEIKKKVTTLYAFVRVADDFVDQLPADEAGFNQFVETYHRVRAKDMYGLPDESWMHVVVDFSVLQDEVGIEEERVEAFLAAMRADLHKKNYQTIDETIEYMYGSAEVIGLMLSRIFGLHKEAHFSARMLGRAMQYANFIRDVAEDNQLGRQYLPMADLREFGLKDLKEKTARAHPNEFIKLMQFEIDRYLQWQKEAENSYHYLPRRIRIGVKTAADMYVWATEQIARDPMIVFQRKVKPSQVRVLWGGVKNLLRSMSS